MRKKNIKELKDLMYESMLDFYYDQLEQYIRIEYQELLHIKNIDFYVEKNRCEFTLYIDNKDRCDEYGFYDGHCELDHLHPEDLFYVLHNLDKEFKHINKRIKNYFNVEREIKSHEK